MLKLAKNVELNEVIRMNGGFGHTNLNPCGNLVVDKEYDFDNDHVILTISGWDGDLRVRFGFEDFVSVE